MSSDGRVTLRAIGWVRSARDEAIDVDWDKIETSIALDPAQFTAAAIASLDQFSHIEVIFHFDRVPDDEVQMGGRHPRGRKDWPLVGIFAQRAKGRPNRIGSTACRLLGIDGLTLRVQGLDAINGTPVLDIKPVMKGFLPRGEIREPAWAEELLKEYW